MKRTARISIFALAALLLLAMAWLSPSSFGVSPYVPWVWHNSGIYIRSDGAVEPTGVSIQRWGSVYNLTGDLYMGLAIQRSNITINGNGYRLFGSYYGTGILLQNVTGVTVQNVSVQYFGQGIYLENSNNSVLKQNIVAGCGIQIASPSWNTSIKDNNVFGGISMSFSNENTIESSNASFISISWSKNVIVSKNRIADTKHVEADLSLGNYTEGIYVDNSEDLSLINNTVERKDVGIDIWNSRFLNLSGNALIENQVGFKLWGENLQSYLHDIDNSNTVNGKPVYFLINRNDYHVPSDAGWIAAVNCTNIQIQNWNSTPNWDGLLFVGTTNSKIINCNLTKNFNGIRFDAVFNSTVIQSTIWDNHFAALYLENTSKCTIKENVVYDNHCLFYLWQSSKDNEVYHNDFISNWTGSSQNNFRNHWDNGAEGNYWSGFTGVDLNGDGISETPYLVDSTSGEKDNYPLMAPLNAFTPLPSPPSNTSAFYLAMPEEYLNYTITNFNGALGAKIHGVYPMHLSGWTGEPLPMVYPIPPGTENIKIILDGSELKWSTYDEVDPDARHYTDIGNWKMIECLVQPSRSDFLLEIQYEHPVEVINGSHVFLYDLNISPYLSPYSTKSSAHFNIKLPENTSNVNVFTTGFKGKWTPTNFTRSTNHLGDSITFTIISEYNKPLNGDIAIVIGSSEIPEFSFWVIFAFLVVATSFTLFLRKIRVVQKPE